MVTGRGANAASTPAVDSRLRVLVGKRVAHHESEFGAIQADSFGADFQSGDEIGQQTGIGLQ